jgi:hypothetical protein
MSISKSHVGASEKLGDQGLVLLGPSLKNCRFWKDIFVAMMSARNYEQQTVGQHIPVLYKIVLTASGLATTTCHPNCPQTDIIPLVSFQYGSTNLLDRSSSFSPANNDFIIDIADILFKCPNFLGYAKTRYTLLTT